MLHMYDPHCVILLIYFTQKAKPRISYLGIAKELTLGDSVPRVSGIIDVYKCMYMYLICTIENMFFRIYFLLPDTAAWYIINYLTLLESYNMRGVGQYSHHQSQYRPIMPGKGTGGRGVESHCLSWKPFTIVKTSLIPPLSPNRKTCNMQEIYYLSIKYQWVKHNQFMLNEKHP